MPLLIFSGDDKSVAVCPLSAFSFFKKYSDFIANYCRILFNIKSNFLENGRLLEFCLNLILLPFLKHLEHFLHI